MSNQSGSQINLFTFHFVASVLVIPNLFKDMNFFIIELKNSCEWTKMPKWSKLPRKPKYLIKYIFNIFVKSNLKEIF